MTQYTHLIDRARQLEAAEEWAKGVKYIYLADGIIETKFNNGDKLFESDGKKRFEKGNMTNEELINKAVRSLADLGRSLDVDGNFQKKSV